MCSKSLTTLNRTLVELKYGIVYAVEPKLPALNRTLVELKLLTETRAQTDCLS